MVFNLNNLNLKIKYKICTVKITFMKLNCKDSSNEFIFSIFIMIRKYHIDRAWIGLNDQHKENHFVWFKKNYKRGYKKWCRNEPNDHKHRENCVELRTRYHCLNDIQCYIDRPFICEINDWKKNVSFYFK